MDDADGDADAVQAAGGDHEAHAVEEHALSAWQLGAVGVAVEDREEADEATATASGGRSANITTRPRTTAEAAMPTSRPGSGTPSSPTRPPSAIIMGKVTGKSHSAGAPS